MDRYDIGVKPAEASRLATSPCHRFRDSAGEYRNHVWHITCIRLAYLRNEDYPNTFRAVIQLDPVDSAMADGLTKLMTRDKEVSPDKAEEHAGLGQLIGHTFSIITFNWTAFLVEAESHLEGMSTTCLSPSLSPTLHLSTTRSLHHLLPLWTQARRRLIAAKDLAEQLTSHPFFASINGADNSAAVRARLVRKVKILDDQIGRCNELAEQTQVLISLLFNIATLQDARAAVEESRAANEVAGSVRRVAVLTFVVLPLTLASSIFGMNVTEITGGDTDSPLWAYFVLAVPLMAATFGGWYLWSRRPVERMRQRREKEDKDV
ncbi:hypothetical protein IQ06DRAFT_143121 [Phaeosphaeriaceae sp. SRC1lsM3a]|nr:hypothetical protein IQ06DRAFT_143121 [Stagonospora sp. SRC1lsM3a]